MNETDKIHVIINKLEPGNESWGIELQRIYDNLISDAAKSHQKIEEIRTEIANYMCAEGCSCCRNIEEHRKHGNKLGELLNVPMYDDNSGYDFSKFESK